jgi:hypothetical protein
VRKPIPSKGHRPSAGHLHFGPAVEVQHGPLRKMVTQMLCDKCGQPVIWRRGLHNGRWVHGGES